MLPFRLPEDDPPALGRLHDLRVVERAGSNPRRLSRNPPRPSPAPWHAALICNPDFVNTASTSRLKLTDSSTFAPGDRNGNTGPSPRPR